MLTCPYSSCPFKHRDQCSNWDKSACWCMQPAEASFAGMTMATVTMAISAFLLLAMIDFFTRR